MLHAMCRRVPRPRVRSAARTNVPPRPSGRPFRGPRPFGVVLRLGQNAAASLLLACAGGSLLRLTNGEGRVPVGGAKPDARSGPAGLSTQHGY